VSRRVRPERCEDDCWPPAAPAGCRRQRRAAAPTVTEGVTTLEYVDTAVSAGPGLRWAAMGPTMLFHLGAGEGGLAAFCERYAESFHRWWDHLGHHASTTDSPGEGNCYFPVTIAFRARSRPSEADQAHVPGRGIRETATPIAAAATCALDRYWYATGTQLYVLAQSSTESTVRSVRSLEDSSAI
jgi:hypothetical protein